MTKTQIGLLVFPKVTQLDLTGPFEVLSRIPGAQVHLVWRDTDLITSDAGLVLKPSVSFADCPPLDVICVPGGQGQFDFLEDDETIGFVHRQGSSAKYVTSVCTGSLVLGAAGLLSGYRAASHWLFEDQLPLFGATPVRERIVHDRNRITGGGITAGIDFGFYLAAQLAGEDVAKSIQLMIEYNPAPPFSSGTPETADPGLVSSMRASMAARLQNRREISARAARRMGERKIAGF
jgi:cyclohexyl-isocyanide hydratase